MQSHRRTEWHKPEADKQKREVERQKVEAELKAEVEPLLLVPVYLVIIAWVLYFLGHW